MTPADKSRYGHPRSACEDATCGNLSELPPTSSRASCKDMDAQAGRESVFKYCFSPYLPRTPCSRPPAVVPAVKIWMRKRGVSQCLSTASAHICRAHHGSLLAVLSHSDKACMLFPLLWHQCLLRVQGMQGIL